MSDKEKNRRKRRFTDLIFEKTGITSDEISGGVTLEMRGRNYLLISGCKRIEKYSPTVMVMRVGKDLLCVCGEGLICSSYHGGTVSIEGIINTIGFEGEEK